MDTVDAWLDGLNDAWMAVEKAADVIAGFWCLLKMPL